MSARQAPDLEPETARAFVEAGICPLCRRGPFVVVSVHTNKMHGIDKYALREMAGMTTNEPTCSPEYSARAAELGARRADEMRKHAEALKGKRRGERRWTKAGRLRVTENLAEWQERPEASDARTAAAQASKTPEARRRQAESLTQRWAEMTPEERKAAASHLSRTPDEQQQIALAAWDKRGRQGCGTRAAYRRGCRCDYCRAAYLAYRRKHG